MFQHDYGNYTDIGHTGDTGDGNYTNMDGDTDDGSHVNSEVHTEDPEDDNQTQTTEVNHNESESEVTSNMSEVDDTLDGIVPLLESSTIHEDETVVENIYSVLGKSDFKKKVT